MIKNQHRSLRVVAAMAGAGMLLGAGIGAAQAQPMLTPTKSVPDSVLVDSQTAPLSDRIAAQLRLAPGGDQISANEVSWDGGNVVAVLPLDGESIAPVSSSAALTVGGQAAARSKSALAAASIEGCPTQIIGNDYYCFYANGNWGGRRLQFKDCNQVVNFDDYGFSNMTSSWVNGGGATISVYNGEFMAGPVGSTSPGKLLWTEPDHSKSSTVAASNNNKASSFEAGGC